MLCIKLFPLPIHKVALLEGVQSPEVHLPDGTSHHQALLLLRVDCHVMMPRSLKDRLFTFDTKLHGDEASSICLLPTLADREPKANLQLFCIELFSDPLGLLTSAPFGQGRPRKKLIFLQSEQSGEVLGPDVRPDIHPDVRGISRTKTFSVGCFPVPEQGLLRRFLSPRFTNFPFCCIAANKLAEANSIRSGHFTLQSQIWTQDTFRAHVLTTEESLISRLQIMLP